MTKEKKGRGRGRESENCKHTCALVVEHILDVNDRYIQSIEHMVHLKTIFMCDVILTRGSVTNAHAILTMCVSPRLKVCKYEVFVFLFENVD